MPLGGKSPKEPDAFAQAVPRVGPGRAAAAWSEALAAAGALLGASRLCHPLPNVNAVKNGKP